MVKLKTKLFNSIMFIFGLFSFAVMYAAIYSSWTNNDAGEIWNDTWILSWVLSIEENNTDEYNNDSIRWYILPWELNSDLFWNWSFEKLTLIDSFSWTNWCKDTDWSSIVTYDISGTFESDFYWEMEISNWSYYCPTTFAFDIDISWSWLWVKNFITCYRLII